MALFVHHADSDYKARQKLISLGMDGGEARLCVASATTARTRQHNCGVIGGKRVIVRFRGGTKFDIEVRS